MKKLFEGKGGISAQIVADSFSAVNGQRITTMELVYHRFIHCFDDQTEVLCRQSEHVVPTFMKFAEAALLDCEVAQVTPELTVSFVKPNAWIENNFSGELLQMKNQRLDFMVTDEHRLFVGSRKSWGDKREVILAKDLLGNHTQKRFYKSAVMDNLVEHGENLVKLLAFFISDGSLPRHGKQAIFHFRKERKIDEVVRLLTLLGVKHDVRPYADGSTNIVFDRLPWMEDCYSAEELGRVKCLPVEFFNMSLQDFSVFKQGLLESDGCVANHEFNTCSEILIEQLQALFHVHGEAFNLKCYDGTYKVKFLKEDTPVLRCDKHKVVKVPYCGKVFCVNVPTGLIMVRRNGIVHVSGNCELMTHRMFSRNAMSSRAIPVERMISLVETSPAVPIHWGANRAGMQANEELNTPVVVGNVRAIMSREEAWDCAKNAAVNMAKSFAASGYHKQLVNRLLEPFQLMKTLVTFTESDNFFHLRDHADSEPHIQELARVMKEAMQDSEPSVLQVGMWHTPYVDWTICEIEGMDVQVFTCIEGGEPACTSLEKALKVSASCAAQISYRRNDQSLEKAIDVYAKLVDSEPVHASAFEHAAMVMSEPVQSDKYLWEDGVTHMDKQGNLWSGNFKGFVQYRQLIPNNVYNGETNG